MSSRRNIMRVKPAPHCVTLQRGTKISIVILALIIALTALATLPFNVYASNPTIIQSAVYYQTGCVSGTTYYANFTSTTTAGDIIVVATSIYANSNGFTTVSFSDNQSNSYSVQVNASVNNGQYVGIATAKVTTAGITKEFALELTVENDTEPPL